MLKAHCLKERKVGKEKKKKKVGYSSFVSPCDRKYACGVVERLFMHLLLAICMLNCITLKYYRVSGWIDLVDCCCEAHVLT